MISKANIQFVKGLQSKKIRQKYDQFTVEGEKSITELLKSDFNVTNIYALPEWIEANKREIADVKCTEVSDSELKQISVHQAPQKALAIVDIPKYSSKIDNNKFVLALDEIQDPGNLGTIIRIADWYGVENIICSKGSTDVYAPKCINSTMGSFLRVQVHYGDIIQFANENSLPIITAALDGENIHSSKLPNKGLLVIGNEGHGVSKDIQKASSMLLTIPRFGEAESLNAAVSTAIILDNLFRSY